MVAYTHSLAIFLRIALAVGAGSLALTDGFDPLAVLLAASFAILMLSYRVRERAVLNNEGITLSYVPFGIGPLPLLKREIFVSWSGVAAVCPGPALTWPLLLYEVTLETDDKNVRWVLGPHVKGYRQALIEVARCTRPEVVDVEITQKLKGWKQNYAA